MGRQHTATGVGGFNGLGEQRPGEPVEYRDLAPDEIAVGLSVVVQRTVLIERDHGGNRLDTRDGHTVGAFAARIALGEPISGVIISCEEAPTDTSYVSIKPHDVALPTAIVHHPASRNWTFHRLEMDGEVTVGQLENIAVFSVPAVAAHGVDRIAA